MTQIMIWNVLLSAGCLLLAGCPSMMAIHHPAIDRQVEVAQPPDVAWQHALQTTTRLGAMVWHQDNQTRTLHAYVGGTTELHVQVTARGQASTLLLHEQPLPSYLTTGTPAQVAERFLALYPQ